MSQPARGAETGASGDNQPIGWDRFLECTALGQFQQSSRWARVKSRDGWGVERLLLDGLHPERGGVQLLWKVSRLGRIGYVSKGPVVPGEDPRDVGRLLDQLERRLRQLRLRAILLQPPDHSKIPGELLAQRGYSRQIVPTIIRSTAEIDLAPGREGLLASMGRQTRREARQAVNRGARVFTGGRADLPRFFDLMLGSCRRQGTSPNPHRLDLLEALWDEFSPRVYLGLGTVDGELSAGLLMVGHGSRLFFWKKGWNSLASRAYINTLLNVEALGWACDWGYQTVDFAAIDPGIAETILAGRELDAAQLRSRDMFNLRLGARPRLLPPARLLIVNPLLRRLFRLAGRLPGLESAVLSRVGAGA